MFLLNNTNGTCDNSNNNSNEGNIRCSSGNFSTNTNDEVTYEDSSNSNNDYGTSLGKYEWLYDLVWQWER